MTTPWSHHPNAKHIDLVFKLIKKYPGKWFNPHIHNIEEWKGAWNAARNELRDGAWNEIWMIIHYETVKDGKTIYTARNTRDTWLLPGTARGTILALLTYDDCAHLLYSDPGEVELLAKLGSIPAALIYPICIILNETKEIE